MDSKNIEYLIHRILSGKNIFTYDNTQYELHKPSLSLRLQSDLIYRNTYENNLFNDFWLLEDIPSLAIDIGILDYGYKKQLEKIEKNLENEKVELYRNFLDIAKKKRHKNRIENIKSNYNSLYSSIHYLDYISLEHYCEKIKNEFLIINSLYRSDTKELVFKNQNIEYNLFNNIISEISATIIHIDIYKQIAKNEYWKSLWSNNKFNIIDEPVNEWSDEQKTLFNISIMYDKIYEHPECPTDDIIADDDALDGWMILQKRENLKQKQEKGVDTMLSDKVKNSSEIFLMAPNKDQANSIRELNSEQSLRRLQQKVDFVTSSEGPVKESQLPDVKKQIIEQLKGK